LFGHVPLIGDIKYCCGASVMRKFGFAEARIWVTSLAIRENMQANVTGKSLDEKSVLESLHFPGHPMQNQYHLHAVLPQPESQPVEKLFGPGIGTERPETSARPACHDYHHDIMLPGGHFRVPFWRKKLYSLS